MFSFGSTFIDFVKGLNQAQDPRVFTSWLVGRLLHNFWAPLQKRVFLASTLPFLAYIVTTLAFLGASLDQRENEAEVSDSIRWHAYIAAPFWLYQLILEVTQIYR